jgi:hypothetical protein
MKYGIIALLLVISPVICAQETDSTKKVSPYELISGFYNGGDFHPFLKGNGYVGLAFTVEDKQLTNTQRLFDKVTDGQNTSYEITFKGGYFLWDYVQVGMNVIYGRDKFEGQLIDQNSDSVSRASIFTGGSFVPYLKIYFPVSKNERLSFFLENGVGFGFGNTLQRDTRNTDQITKRYTEEFLFTLGISPGITFFAIENFAFEVQLNNLLGYEYARKNTTTDEIEESTTVTNNVNFRIELLSLRLGLAYYFNKKN